MNAPHWKKSTLALMERDHIVPTMRGNREAREAGKGVYCADWNSEAPQRVFDTRTGHCIGTLVPVDHELVARSPGIQPWSKGRH